MHIRQRLEAFWSGDRPDQIPFTIYQNEWRHKASDPAWESMFENGLGITWNIPSYRTILQGVETREERYTENKRPMYRHIFSTPLGEISSTWLIGVDMDDWPCKYYLETPQDYRVMHYIVKHTNIVPDYQQYLDVAQALPEYCVPLVPIGYSPMLKIMLDLTGLINFSVHLYDFKDELIDLYEALCEQFNQICEITAGGPGRFVANLESFSADTLGPKRFKEYVLSVYEHDFPALRSAGKIVGCHFDGKTASCKDLIRNAPIDLIESLTPPPEGDQTLAEARHNWPDLLFWANINVSSYNLPPRQLKDTVLDLVSQAAQDGRKLAFEISEHCPVNWKESIPVVLEALKETRV
jgi:hypothetical protein